MSVDQLIDYLAIAIINTYQKRTEGLEPDLLVRFERSLILHYLDNLWREHLTHLELARQHVSLRGYAQKDPKQEYKLEAFKLFEAFMAYFASSVVSALMRAKFLNKDELEALEGEETKLKQKMELSGRKKTIIELTPDRAHKTSRNDLCACQSGKKYKHCCGKILT